MRKLTSVCVYAGSQAGARDAYRTGSEGLARLLAAQEIDVVYGGGKVGPMGAVADAGLGAGGCGTGIIPTALRDRELAHPGLSDLRVVASMHEREALMAEPSDAFVAVPGGIGTLEELAERLRAFSAPDVAPLAAAVRRGDELSLVCAAGAVPPQVTADRGLFAPATYDTDVLLVPAARLADAVGALRAVGRTVLD